MITTAPVALTAAQAHALDILCEEGGEATLDVLTTEGGIRTTTINALARRGIVTLDGPWVEYRGEPGAPIYSTPGGGWWWRCPCGSRGSGGSQGEARDWRDHHLATHPECR